MMTSCSNDDTRQSSISLTSAKARITNDQRIEVEARLEHQFSAAVVEALENGVHMQFRWHLEIHHDDDAFWEGPIWKQAGYREVAYRSLSERFTIATVPPGITNSVDTISLLQTELDQFNLSLPLSEPLTDTNALELNVRFDLDINSLPPPLKLPSYLSTDWYMDSDWQQIRISG